MTPHDFLPWVEGRIARRNRCDLVVILAILSVFGLLIWCLQ